MSDAWILTSKNVCLDDKLQQAWIMITDEKIASVLDHPPQGFKGKVLDIGNIVVMPGLVDTHVHINEPGRTEWEGFATATHAAAAGGVTTLVDMPLNCIPVTTTSAALKIKQDSIKDKLWVDIGFWGGATPENFPELPALLKSGVLGVKSFMIDSGIAEFPPMSLQQIAQAMPLLASQKLPYLFHAELDQGETKKLPQGPSYQLFLQSRPKVWENNAITNLIKLAQKHHAKIHIVHLSSAEALQVIRQAKKTNVQITVETCPHYLLLSDQQVEEFRPQDEQTLFKCCPPIREEENRQALWQGLLDGTIDMVVSDHSPCTPALKCFGSHDFAKAWGGISSLQYTLSLLWTEGQKFSLSIPKLSQLLSRNPAQLAGLSAYKGIIASGADADFIIFNPEERWTINAQTTYHRHKASPYQGRKVLGKVLKTYLRGKLIFDAGTFTTEAQGKFLLRGKI